MGKIAKRTEWTPVELETMLHCFYSPASPGTSQATREAITRLRAKNMIEARPASSTPGFEQDGWAATEKGVVFVQALLAMPEPVAATRWEIPAKEQA